MGFSPLVAACGNGHVEVVKVLLSDNRVNMKSENKARMGLDLSTYDYDDADEFGVYFCV